MPLRTPRVILLTGAPDARLLETKNESLHNDFLPTIRAVFEGRSLSPKANTVSSQTYPTWRQIATDVCNDISTHDPARPGLAVRHRTKKEVVGLAKVRDEEDQLAFLEHVLNAIPEPANAVEASLLDDASTRHDLSMSTTCTPTEMLSFVTAITDSFHNLSFDNGALLARRSINDLRSLPTQHDLSRLYPQTVTANVLGGIISISPPRTVHVPARWGPQPTQPVELIEVCLGDDTATGFRVTYWLAAPRTRGKANSAQHQALAAEQMQMRQCLLNLRLGDVVLITHVALTTFRSKVCGRSLRPRIKEGLATRIFRFDEDLDTDGSPNVEKLLRVRRWASDFIGPPLRTAKRGNSGDEGDRFRRRIRLDDDLPDDTQ